MVAFSSIFGETARVKIVETLAENSGEPMTVREIKDTAGVSRMEAHLVVRKLTSEGIITEIPSEGREGKRYSPNLNDIRGKALPFLEKIFTLAALESEMKADENIAQSEPLPTGFLTEHLSLSELIGNEIGYTDPIKRQFSFEFIEGPLASYVSSGIPLVALKDNVSQLIEMRRGKMTMVDKPSIFLQIPQSGSTGYAAAN